MPGSASFTNFPSNGPPVSVPSSATGSRKHQPLVTPQLVVLLAERAGAMCTTPVPSSVATNSAPTMRRSGASPVLDELRAAVDEGERLDALPLARLVERLGSAGRRAIEPSKRAEDGAGVALRQHVAAARLGDDEPPVAVLDERVLGLGRDGRARCWPATSTASWSTRGTEVGTPSARRSASSAPAFAPSAARVKSTVHARVGRVPRW